MKKYIPIVAKVLLSLLLITPILGSLGIFPAPTRELYTSDAAFRFIQTLMLDATYVTYLNSIVCVLSLILLWAKREALAALILLPLSVHIMAFHMFLDGGLFQGGAVMGEILFVLNLYFLYTHRAAFAGLCQKSA